MSRAVTADHVLFDECIHAFRRSNESRPPFMEGDSRSYLLTSFHLPSTWQFPYTKVLPSIEVHLPGALAAFICTVENPTWVGTHNAHLYGLAMAAVVSFATGRPCQSTRDDYLCRRQEVTEHDLVQMAVHHPVLIAGPGCISPRLSQKTLHEYESNISSLISTLHAAPFKKYVSVMQAIRLIHLSLINKRNDFGLAYLLLISAIESIAQHAIDRNSVKQTHPQEGKWKTKAKSDPEFAELLNQYKNMRGQNSYLKERYVRFINEYSPHEGWEEIVRHPMQDWSEYIRETSPDHNVEHLTQKSWHEAYPQDLPKGMINEILESSYKHRSCFIHRGEQPPHRDPTSYNRFFQEVYSIEGGHYITALLPNYSLMLAIAQKSITKWAESL